jgi:hypothetical protein
MSIVGADTTLNDLTVTDDRHADILRTADGVRLADRRQLHVDRFEQPGNGTDLAEFRKRFGTILP